MERIAPGRCAAKRRPRGIARPDLCFSLFAIESKIYAAGQQRSATLRGEFAGSWEGGQSSEKATVWQSGDSFKAEIFVPVWTSQLFVSDWWQPAPVPLTANVQPSGDGWQVSVENHTDQKLTTAQIVIGDYILPLGELPPRQSKSFSLTKAQGILLREYLGQHGQSFQQAAQSRQQGFGTSEGGHPSDPPNRAVAASFVSQLARQNNNYMFNFIAPPGLDLTSVVEHGNAVLFAWAGDYSPVKPMNQFSPTRLHRDTLWRFAVPVLGRKMDPEKR